MIRPARRPMERPLALRFAGLAQDILLPRTGGVAPALRS